MFPSVKQRLLILLAAVISAVLLVVIAHAGNLTSSDGSTGLSLFSTKAETLMAFLVMLVAVVPAIVLAAFTASTGNPLSGLFVLGATIAILAIDGGSMAGWRWRMEGVNELPQAYGRLMLEVLMWQVPVILLVVAINRWRESLRAVVPAKLVEREPLCATLGPVFHGQTLWATLLCAAVSGVLGHFILVTADSAQVIVGLLIAFSIGGLVARLFFAHAGLAGMLFSPALVALGAYGYVAFHFQSQGEFVQAWQSSTLTGLALALPIHYASAAVAGVAIGIGWAQSLESAHDSHAETEPTAREQRT